METLKLSPTELEEMKAFYQEELTRTVARLQHLKSILDQLGGKSANISVSFDGAQTSSHTEAAEPARRKGKKRGPKSVWGSFILKRLQQLDRPLTYNELVDEAMVFFKLAEEKRQTVVNAINNSAFRLRKNSRRIDTFSVGGREKYVALKSWFDSNGSIKSDYKQKVNKPGKTAANKAVRNTRAVATSNRKPRARAKNVSKK